MGLFKPKLHPTLKRHKMLIKRIRMNNTRTQQVKEWFGWDDTVVNKVKEMKQARGLLSAYRIMLLEKGEVK